MQRRSKSVEKPPAGNGDDRITLVWRDTIGDETHISVNDRSGLPSSGVAGT